MLLCALGLSHMTAPVEVRERVVFPLETLQDSLRTLTHGSSVREAAVISTCNRTEVYAVLEADGDPAQVLRWLASSHGVEPDWLEPFLYRHAGRDVVRHLLRVTPGLDSLVLGEPQIAGQTKTAYLEAATAGTIGPVLDRLFQHAFTVSKQVRTETEIGAHPVSVAFAAVSLARQIFGALEESTALLVGAGETIDLTARHLHQQGVRQFIVANRTRARAEELASQYGGRAIALGELPDTLVEADIVVSSTAAPLPILGKGSVERALRKRRHRPIFMVDIAVPRDIEPEVSQLDDIYLYTVDDLRGVIEANLRSRNHAAVEAEEIIELQVERFMTWLRSLESVPTIRGFRQRAGAHREEVLRRARRRLAKGESPEEALDYLAHTLTNRLLHLPTRRLRDAAAEGENALLEAAQRLLDLGDEQDKE